MDVDLENSREPEGRMLPQGDPVVGTSTDGQHNRDKKSDTKNLAEKSNRKQEDRPPQVNEKPIEVVISKDRTVLTMEPYKAPNVRERGTHRRGRRPALHKIGQQEFPNLSSQAPENFTRFYTITSESGVKLSEINVIKANKEIENLLKGTPNTITETRKGHLVVEVKSKKQSHNLMKLNKLDSTRVTVEPHKTL